VAITGTSLADAAGRFRDHLNGVLHRTITQASLTRLMVKGPPERALLRLPETGVALSSNFGRMWLYLGQTCNSTIRDDDGRHVLHTISYRYTLRPDGMNKPLFRWEYVKAPHNLYCRHHFQGPIRVDVKRDAWVSLNDLHVPTGFVTIEEVLRFCIEDLKVPSLAPRERPAAPSEPGAHDFKPPQTWDEILTESYEKFKTDFAPRGQLE
jgi:hypothetical protein